MQPVAVKELKSANFESLIFEANVMHQLHLKSVPNVVHLLGVCVDQPQQNPCLVLDYIKNQTLSQLLKNQQKVLDWSVRWRLAYDIANGLSHLHNHTPTILHRDLKSDNILLD